MNDAIHAHNFYMEFVGWPTDACQLAIQLYDKCNITIDKNCCNDLFIRPVTAVNSFKFYIAYQVKECRWHMSNSLKQVYATWFLLNLFNCAIIAYAYPTKKSHKFSRYKHHAILLEYINDKEEFSMIIL